MLEKLLKANWTVVCLGLVAVVVAGCITGREDLVQAGEIKLVTVNSQKTKFSMVRVYIEEDELVGHGRVKRRGLFAVAGGGHVDIEILDSNGDAIAKDDTKYSPRLIRGGHSSPFKKRFPLVEHKVETVRLTHHPRSYSHIEKI